MESLQPQSQVRHRYTPDLAWTRTQLGLIQSPKHRNIWGEAFHNILIEGLSAVPLMEAYQQGEYPIVTGLHIYKRLPEIIALKLKGEEGPSFGVGPDFKRFDSSLQRWIMNDAFDILEENVTFPTFYEKAAFEYSRYYFTYRPIVMPDGRMWAKQLGLPSGSYFTQLIGSIANHIAITFLQLKAHNRVFKTYILGDDSIFGIPPNHGEPNLQYYAEILSRIGLTLNTEKSIVTTTPIELKFLGHTARHTRVKREDAELIALSLFSEYPIESPAISFSRLTSLLLDSGLNSWPMVNLYQYARIKLCELNVEPPESFDASDETWFQSVATMISGPSEIDIPRAFLLT